jgi:uncharacterized protein DUF3179
VDLAAVYSRQIDGRNLTLAPTGWTYNNTFVLYDKETGSLWYPEALGLRGIQGHFFRRRLSLVKSEDTHMGPWVKKHPHTLVVR